MVISYRKWWNRLKFIVTFIVLTFIMYHVLAYVSDWIGPVNKYREPNGRSVKVFRDHGGLTGNESIADRLRLFYWYGE